MARLQILELPEGVGDDRPPFVLVVDGYTPQRYVLGPDQAEPASEFDGIAEQIGARAVLVFEETIDIPANDLTLTHVQEAADGGVIRLRVEPDLTGFTEKVWTEADKALAGVIDAARRQMIDELGEERAAPNGEEIPAMEALGYRTMGLAYSLEEAQAAIERVRNLHRPVEHRGQTICWECSDYDFPGQTTDSAPVAHDQCNTLRVLNQKRDETGPSHG